MDKKFEFMIRPMVNNDEVWIKNTWASSQLMDIVRRLERDQEHLERKHLKLNEDLIWTSLNCLADSVISHDSTSVIVACDPEDIDQTFGYVVYSERTLHWIYTKQSFREAGVASELMRHAFMSFDMPIYISTITYAIGHYKSKWNLELDFNSIRRFK